MAEESKAFSIYTEKQRIARIKKEKKKLKIIFENLDDSTKSCVENLVDDAAFMTVTLEETRQLIARDGVVEVYQNGENQKGVKKAAAVEVYDKMLNTYAKIIKQLTDLLPKRVYIENTGEVKELEDDSAESLKAYVASFVKK